MKRTTIKPAFVEFIPETLAEGTLFVSNRFKLAVHRCCCGCGGEVVTPLSPAQWRLRRQDERVSLTPSIGNWSLPCQSHYWIRDNAVLWERPMSAGQIARVRTRDKRDMERHVDEVNATKEAGAAGLKQGAKEEAAPPPLAARLRRWFGF